jgi:GTP-binding protein
MTFIDEMNIHVRAGKGGNGVVRWLHEYAKEFGGPSGGNGGRGGSVFVRAIADTFYLRKYATTRIFLAEDGFYGEGDSCHGKGGEDLYIDLPVGTIITRTHDVNIHDSDTIVNQEVELIEVGQTVRILKGGSGGLGNENFKSSINIKPEEWTEGKPGEEADFHVEVRMIADVGLIGLPNAGKSSLLNSLTKADVKVGNYAFTTLEPNLGALYEIILADIPGLIEGASDGKGLGHKFLKHIKRTKMLAHLVSLEQDIDEMVNVYNVIRNELKEFDVELLEKKEIILLTKSDILGVEESEKKAKDFLKKINKEDSLSKVISIYDMDNLKDLKDWLIKIVRDEVKVEVEE